MEVVRRWCGYDVELDGDEGGDEDGVEVVWKCQWCGVNCIDETVVRPT